MFLLCFLTLSSRFYLQKSPTSPSLLDDFERCTNVGPDRSRNSVLCCRWDSFCVFRWLICIDAMLCFQKHCCFMLFFDIERKTNDSCVSFKSWWIQTVCCLSWWHQDSSVGQHPTCGIISGAGSVGNLQIWWLNLQVRRRSKDRLFFFFLDLKEQLVRSYATAINRISFVIGKAFPFFWVGFDISGNLCSGSEYKSDEPSIYRNLHVFIPEVLKNPRVKLRFSVFLIFFVLVFEQKKQNTCCFSNQRSDNKKVTTNFAFAQAQLDRPHMDFAAEAVKWQDVVDGQRKPPRSCFGIFWGLKQSWHINYITVNLLKYIILLNTTKCYKQLITSKKWHLGHGAFLRGRLAQETHAKAAAKLEALNFFQVNKWFTHICFMVGIDVGIW